jgi:hypothetical protein
MWTSGFEMCLGDGSSDASSGDPFQLCRLAEPRATAVQISKLIRLSPNVRPTPRNSKSSDCNGRQRKFHFLESLRSSSKKGPSVSFLISRQVARLNLKSAGYCFSGAMFQ